MAERKNSGAPDLGGWIIAAGMGLVAFGVAKVVGGFDLMPSAFFGFLVFLVSGLVMGMPLGASGPSDNGAGTGALVARLDGGTKAAAAMKMAAQGISAGAAGGTLGGTMAGGTMAGGAQPAVSADGVAGGASLGGAAGVMGAVSMAQSAGLDPVAVSAAPAVSAPVGFLSVPPATTSPSEIAEKVAAAPLALAEKTPAAKAKRPPAMKAEKVPGVKVPKAAGAKADKAAAANAVMAPKGAAVKAAAKPKATKPAKADGPERLTAPRGGKADDLKEIEGIGPAMERLVNGLGFYHFAQIAGWSDADVAWVDDHMKTFRGRIVRDKWVAQSKLIVAEGLDAFRIRAKTNDY